MTADKTSLSLPAARPVQRAFSRRARGVLVTALVAAFALAEAPARAVPESTSPAAPQPRKPKAKPRAPAKSEAAKKEPPPEMPPLASDALLESARALFDAIVQGKPELADGFFFPRAPFLPLKDVDDPGRYHDELVRVYHHDIQKLHKRRRSWDGARFVGFRLGSPPKWIEPGREWNKLGYYRTFDARLDYEVAGRALRLTVRTIISWEGKWYVTHLLPVKH